MRRITIAVAASCVSVPLVAQVASAPAPGKPTAASNLAAISAAEAEEPVSAAEARETAAGFARLLEENFLYPDVAKKYAETVRGRAAKGEYDAAGTRGALAAALTKHAQAIHADGHLKIFPLSAAAAPQPQMMIVQAPAQQAQVEPATPGPGKPIEEARWLASGVAYIRFTVFTPGDPSVGAGAARFMEDHADAKTVIIDVRTHRGGSGAPTAALAPYLFGKETVFYSQDMRSSVAQSMGGGSNLPPWMRQVAPAAAGVVTRENVVRPHPSERRLFDAKVYVLISGFTASAAEGLAFGLKSTGRATLVGEKTAGAGNFAPAGQRVNDKFAAIVPIGRSYDPRTGEGWEGVGVAPDVTVPAEKALVEVLRRIGISADEAERLSASVDPKGPMKKPAPSS